ncbi:Aconitate hydratase protein [Mannheimia sp. USDA-ARS-USMARC-1261]|uniref:hypothetical protein n=1 Tax=Mannheimia sp. USDA-ARS-USMARC-1261 TaxID=1432056 RepID=UPI0003E366BB|nr:hypothetical protein [Mannheimia sp. USDA-ARS-USMARC-1261]AHG72654.1 Aconitate hydratase protein [Mannheimia sp. USDA-ARS-USMARC-1261]
MSLELSCAKVIVAEGFERIHRTNLVGMGVLPLQFVGGQNRHTLKLDGTEIYAVQGEISARCELELVIKRKNGEIETVPVLCRLDSDSDVRTYKAGGVLREFASKFLDS